MSQSSHSVGNVSAPAFRAAMNDSLQALASLNSGPDAPPTTYANMLWYDTSENTLYMRSEADADPWISIGTLDQGANTFTPAGVAELTQTQVENAASTVFGQVSGERLAQAVAEFETAPTAPTTAEVLSATAGATHGAVGTYAFVYFRASTASFPYNAGDTVAGSLLRYANAAGEQQFSSISGTWQLMGYADSSDIDEKTTLVLRIS